MNNFKKGLIFVGLGLLCSSSIEVAGSLVLSKGIDPLTLLNVRYWIAMPLMFLTVLAFRHSFKVDRKDIPRLFIQSSLLCAHTIIYWLALKAMNDVPSALVIHKLYPIWLFLIAFLYLKENITKARAAALALSTAGVLFLAGFLPYFHLILNTKGAILIGVASVLYALLLLSGKELLKKYSQFTILFYNFLLCNLVLAFLMAPAVVISHVTPAALPWMVFTGVVSTYLLYLFNYTGLKYVKATQFVLIHQLRPLLAMVWAFFFLGQSLHDYQWIGAALVFVAMYFFTKDYKHETN